MATESRWPICIPASICKRTFERAFLLISSHLNSQPETSLVIASNMNQLQFYRALVIWNGAVPGLMLAWDAIDQKLGPNAVNAALHITGILSLVFLFLSLLMTPLRWYTNWTGWIAFRRALGLYGFWYAVLHLGIYVTFDRALSLSSTVHEIWSRTYLQVGFVALFLMVPLAVTSTNAMVRRLGAKRWRELHRIAYLVPLLGVIHYFLLVKSDVRQPLAFAGVLAALFAGRLATFSRRVPDTTPHAMPQSESTSL